MRFIYPSGASHQPSLDMATPTRFGDEAKGPKNEAMEAPRRRRVGERLRPYYHYSLVLGFGSGLLQFPLLSYIVEDVCGDNPGKLAVFSALAYVCYEVPRVSLVMIHGEITDRLPRVPCIFASYCFEIFLWCLICSYAHMGFILFLYFVRAIANVHSFAQSLYVLDLTLYVAGGDLGRLAVGGAEDAKPQTKLLSRAVAADGGLDDVQSGSRRLSGAVVMLAAQLLALRLPESKPRVPGGPGLAELLAEAVAKARAEMWLGFADQRARWAAGEKLLDDLTVFLFLLLGGLTVHLVTLFNVFQYKLDPSVEERIEFGFSLLPPFVIGVFLWIRHFKQGDKAEIYVMPRYQFVLAAALFGAAFASSYAGFLVALAFFFIALPAATILGAMWASQAPWTSRPLRGRLRRHPRRRGGRAVRRREPRVLHDAHGPLVGPRAAPLRARAGDMRPALPMVLGAAMLFAAAVKMRSIANQVRQLVEDRRRRESDARDAHHSKHIASFIDASGKATDAEAAVLLTAARVRPEDGRPTSRDGSTTTRRRRPRRLQPRWL
ncbi:hypothetical protein JL721_1496 [Aureococcus anophagefferens]|nr:hypothetical protein JL721_1496 [Aureococcus anophagefferens]